MTHEELRDRLLDLAYGELPRREARRVEEHAASCEACRAELARIRDTRRVMSALPDEQPAPGGAERILIAAAREAVRGRAPRPRFPRWLWGGAVAAASVAAVVAVSYRLLELRPGPLEREGRDALLGDSPYARAPAPPPADAPRGASPRVAPPEAPAPAGRARGKAAEMEGPPPTPSPRQKRTLGAGPPADAAPEPKAQAPEPEARERSAAVDVEDAAPRAAAPDAGARPRAAASAAPPPAATSAARAAAPETPQDAARGDTAAPRALARYARLREAGRLRGEIRTFTDCEGEAWRKVETDPSGRVVKYVREGRIGGQRLRIEHVYAEDGALSSATVRDLDEPGAPVDADALGLVLPPRASDAGIGAPPRCGR
jgi:hypothetical protein